jgi:hypothetical protein
MDKNGDTVKYRRIINKDVILLVLHFRIEHNQSR